MNSTIYLIVVSFFLNSSSSLAGNAQVKPVWENSEWRARNPNNCSVLPGNQCGCYKGYCWAYKFAHSGAGDPWCYTQPEGTPGGQGVWATCDYDGMCSWAMTCGNNVIHFGSNDSDVVTYSGEPNAASLHAKRQAGLNAQKVQREREQDQRNREDADRRRREIAETARRDQERAKAEQDKREKAKAERVEQEKAQARRVSTDPRVVADQATGDAAAAYSEYETASQAVLNAEKAANQDPLNRTLASARDAARQRELDLRVAARKADFYARGANQIAQDAANQIMIEAIRAGHVEEIRSYKAMIRALCNRIGVPVPEGFED